MSRHGTHIRSRGEARDNWLAPLPRRPRSSSPEAWDPVQCPRDPGGVRQISGAAAAAAEIFPRQTHQTLFHAPNLTPHLQGEAVGVKVGVTLGGGDGRKKVV